MADEIEEIRLLVLLVLRAVEHLQDSSPEAAGLHAVLDKLDALQTRLATLPA